MSEEAIQKALKKHIKEHHKGDYCSLEGSQDCLGKFTVFVLESAEFVSVAELRKKIEKRIVGWQGTKSATGHIEIKAMCNSAMDEDTYFLDLLPKPLEAKKE